MILKIVLSLLICLFSFSCAEKTPDNESANNEISKEVQNSESLIQRFKTKKSFSDVIQELDFAITERNFRITGRNTVGKGMRNRGYENYPDIEVIHFCSLDVAKEVLDIDPGYVAQMPCRVTVHEQDDAVIVSLILLPTDHKDSRVNDFARKMNITLREIVEFALEENAIPLQE